MTISIREQALAALGLAAAPAADAAAVQRAFERLARRYPQSHFPERFRELLEARDRLLEAGRDWREQLTSATLDMSWAYAQLQRMPAVTPDRRTQLQNLLRIGYLAEPLPSSSSFEAMAERMMQELGKKKPF